MCKILKLLINGIYFLTMIPVKIVLFVRKLFYMFFDWLEKYVNPCITMPILFLFIHFAFTYTGFTEEIITKDSWAFFVVFYLIISILATVLYTVEKMAEYMSRKVSLSKLISYVFLILFSLSLMYCIMYYCIFDLYPNCFEGVSCSSNSVVKLFDFFFYSFSIMTTIGGTEVTPITLLSKSLVLLEMITAFLFIVVLIANYENVGRAYKDYLKEISDKEN